MVRTQIQLTDDLAAHVKELAARQHVSMAEMILRAVALLLESVPKTVYSRCRKNFYTEEGARRVYGRAEGQDRKGA